MTVYLVSAGDMLKIGQSKDPRSRLNSLKTNSPIPPVLEFLLDGGFAEELELHRKFEAHWVRGEWYRRCLEIWMFFLHNGYRPGDKTKKTEVKIVANACKICGVTTTSRTRKYCDEHRKVFVESRRKQCCYTNCLEKTVRGRKYCPQHTGLRKPCNVPGCGGARSDGRKRCLKHVGWCPPGATITPIDRFCGEPGCANKISGKKYRDARKKGYVAHCDEHSRRTRSAPRFKCSVEHCHVLATRSSSYGCRYEGTRPYCERHKHGSQNGYRLDVELLHNEPRVVGTST